MSCPYNPSYHFRPEAQNYHLNNCITEKITKMSNEDSCIHYMTSVLNTENTSGCNIEDVRTICKNTTKNFTIQDAKDLCKLEMEGANKFWQTKYPKA